MSETSYRGRRAVSIENGQLRVTVLPGGGHIAAITDLATGANPLWEPKWRSLDPSAFDPAKYPEFGSGSDARLLAGIAGHNLCLDLFGGPSEEEFLAGFTAHGEGSVVDFDVEVEAAGLVERAEMPLAQIRFERRIELNGRVVRIREMVESLAPFDRPIAWTQHATLGEPFLERGQTQFRTTATRSKVFDGAFGADDYLLAGAEFEWPMAPRMSGGTADLRVLNGDSKSGAFTTHLMDSSREDAFFAAFSPRFSLLFGYVWKRRDFPWLGIWEENHSRTFGPWDGRELTRGMEFGVSPMPESRRQMVERGSLFGEPAYRWLPARGRMEAEYFAVLRPAAAMPETLAAEFKPV
jgi:hypothetical protein